MTEIEFLHSDEIKNIDCNIFSVVKYKNGIATFQGFIYRFNNLIYFWNKKNINLYMKSSLIANYRILSQMSFINKNELLKELYEIITRKYKPLKK